MCRRTSLVTTPSTSNLAQFLRLPQVNLFPVWNHYLVNFEILDIRSRWVIQQWIGNGQHIFLALLSNQFLYFNAWLAINSAWLKRCIGPLPTSFKLATAQLHPLNVALVHLILLGTMRSMGTIIPREKSRVVVDCLKKIRNRRPKTFVVEEELWQQQISFLSDLYFSRGFIFRARKCSFFGRDASET